MKRVLIFGGNRFVGKQLSEVLVDKYQVDVFNRSGTSSDDRISVIQGDRNNKQDIGKIDFDKYDYIVDMCLFFPNQLELIIDSIKSKYIFVSSAAANNRYIDYYGDYAKDKLAVEDMLVDSDLDYVIIRPSYIVGKGDHKNRLNYYLESIENETPIKIDGDGRNKINMVFSEDVVNVLYNLIKYWVKDDNRFYYACGDEQINLIDFVTYVNAKYYNKNVNFLFNQKDAIFPNIDFVVDNNYTRRDLDISFTSFYAGVTKYMEWYEVSKS